MNYLLDLQLASSLCPISDQMAQGLSHWYLCADYTLTAIGSMQIAPNMLLLVSTAWFSQNPSCTQLLKGEFSFDFCNHYKVLKHFLHRISVSKAQGVWVGGSLIVAFRKVHPNDSTLNVHPHLPCLNLPLISPACGLHKAVSWNCYQEHPPVQPSQFLGLDCWYRSIALSLILWNRMQECVFSSNIHNRNSFLRYSRSKDKLCQALFTFLISKSVC